MFFCGLIFGLNGFEILIFVSVILIGKWMWIGWCCWSVVLIIFGIFVVVLLGVI